MASYNTDLDTMHTIMAVMNYGTGLYNESDSEGALSLFDEACLTTVVTCGPPPPVPDLFNNQPFVANLPRSYIEAKRVRHAWIDAVEALVRGRYGVPEGRVGDFIVAFETWWSLQQKDADNADQAGA